MVAYPEDWVVDFAERALKNQEIVEKNCGNEVTQMILTFLALVVVPDEKVFDRVEDKTKKEMENDGWPVKGWEWNNFLRPERGNFSPCGLRAFLNMLRNAISHARFEFQDDGKDIVAIEFSHDYNKDYLRGRWKIQELKKALDKLHELLISLKNKRR